MVGLITKWTYEKDNYRAKWYQEYIIFYDDSKIDKSIINKKFRFHLFFKDTI